LKNSSTSHYVLKLEDVRKRCVNDNYEKYKDQIKKIDAAIIKLETTHHINSIWDQIIDSITRKIMYKPYHRDYFTIESINYYNVFPGFKASKISATFQENNIDIRLRKILNHIFVVWAKRDNELYKYLLSWLAHPIRTLTRTNSVLVVIGECGSGKSMIFNFLIKYVYGKDISNIVPDFELVLQRFNGILSGKMLICVDETSTADSKRFNSDFNKFKNKITSDTLQIERKGVEVSEVDNYITYAICSNHSVPIKMEPSDRRYIVIECSNEYIGNGKYFNDLHETCFNEEVGNLLYTYFRSPEFESVLVPLKNIPITEAKLDIIECFTPKYKIFFDDLFLYGQVLIDKSLIIINSSKTDAYIPVTNLFGVFTDWCRSTYRKLTNYSSTFSHELKKYPKIEDGRRKRLNGAYVHIVKITAYRNVVRILMNNGPEGTEEIKLDKYILN
jgi:hypothetical protein